MNVVQGQEDEPTELDIAYLYLILTSEKNNLNNSYETLTTYFINSCNGSEYVGTIFQFLFLYV